MDKLETSAYGQQATILIVDDIRSNQEVLASLLSTDYRVQVAGNGIRALEIAQCHPHPNLILLDVNMPQMDGYQVCQRLLENPLTRNIPVIFVTSAADRESEAYGLELGAVDYISKPINPAITLRRVRNQILLKLRESELKQAAQRLKDSEAYIRSIFDATPDAMLISDEQGVITMVNQQAEHLLGYTISELLGQPIEILVPERFRAGHPALRAKFAAQAVSRPMGVGCEVKALRKDNSEFDAEISLSPIQTGQGLFFASAMRDITERAQNAAKLKASEERFRRMANNSPVMIWLTDSTGEPTFVNQAWFDFVGLDAAQGLTHKAWVNVIHPDDRAAVFTAYFQNTDSYQAITTEYRLRNADGDWRWIIDKGMPLYDENYVFNGYIGSAIDITERKQAQQLL